MKAFHRITKTIVTQFGATRSKERLFWLVKDDLWDYLYWKRFINDLNT